MAKEKKIIIPTRDEIVRTHNYLVGAHSGIPGILNDPGYVSGFCESYLNETGLVPILGFMLSRLTKGHYFSDGNKRTAYFTTRYAALRNGFDLNGTTPRELADEMVKIAEMVAEESRNYSEELVQKELVEFNPALKNFSQFERLVLKGIAVSNILEDK